MSVNTGNTAFREIEVNQYASAVGESGQLVDVREPYEVDEGTLPGALNIPLGQLPDRVGELDPSRPVVLLCRSGGRSGQAAAFLAASGFAEVTNLAGGMLAFEG